MLQSTYWRLSLMFGKMPTKKFYLKNRECVNWKIPGLFENDKIILMLADICNELEIKQPVKSVYGCIFSVWGGEDHRKSSTLRKQN